MFFAELDNQKICCALLDSKGMQASETMIPIETMNTDLIGKRYEKGKWENVPQTEMPYQPTEQEITQAKLDYLLMMQE